MSTATLTRPGLAEMALVTVDAYCRVSVDYDGTTRSVDDQEDDITDAIEESGTWSLGKVHKDHAKSAWQPKVVRPEWNDLMTRLESGQAGGVVVYDLSRFTRKPMEGERLLALAERGIVVASITTTYNLRTADGRKQFRDAMTANAFESDKTSERTSRGKRKKAKRGRSNATNRGFARAGYLRNPPGWEAGDPRTPVPEAELDREVAAVQDAARRILAGELVGRIAKEWNAEGLLTTTGSRWDSSKLRQMLERPAIAGLVEYKGTITADNGDGPLDLETWERLCLTLSSRKRGRPATAYLLSGILTCGLCGSPLYGRPLVSQSPYKDGEVRRQYWCQYRMREQTGCGRITIDQRFADAVVESLVVGRLGDPRHADRVAKVAERVKVEHRSLRAELDRLNGEMDDLTDKTGDPGWTPARVTKALAKYAPRVAEVEAKVKALEALPALGAESASLDAQADWDAGLVADRRLLVKRAFPEGLVVMKAEAPGRNGLKDNRIVPGELVTR